MSDAWVFDSYAILALLQNETGSDTVRERLEQAQQGLTRALMSWVNVGEVLYIVERRWGKDTAHRVLGTLDATALQVVDIDRSLALLAAEIKAGYTLAYADAFAAALAIREDAMLMTGDPEFANVADRISITWLPRRTSASQ